MDTSKKNRVVIEEIFYHLFLAWRLCNQLDLSELPLLEQKEWSDKIKLCKNALEFTKDSVEKLSKFISRGESPHN